MEVLDYFLPPLCRVVPIEFAKGAAAPPGGSAAAEAGKATGGPAREETAAAAAAGPAPDSAASEDASEAAAAAAAAAAAGPGPGGAAPGDAEKEDERLGQALEESLAEAVQQESADVNMALLRSKLDAPPRSLDGVVIWRLTSQSAQIAEAILSSQALAGCRSRVEEAGCEVRPPWAGGAILLVPMTAEQVLEERVAEALRAVPRRRRPQVKPEHQADAAGEERQGSGAHGESAGPSSGADPPRPARAAGAAAGGAADVFEALGVVQEHTFLHCPAGAQNFELSEASAVVQTEPGAGSSSPAPNPRRWRRA